MKKQEEIEEEISGNNDSGRKGPDPEDIASPFDP